MKVSKYFYTYIITNVITGKSYIGKRVSKVKPICDLGIKYFSSSRDYEFMKDQKENPRHYKYEILKVCETHTEIIEHEIYLHEKFDVAKNPMFYNKVKQTSIGFDTTGLKRTPEQIAKQVNRMVGKKYSNERIAASKEGQIKAWKDPNVREKILKTMQSDEYRKNMSNLKKGIKFTAEHKEKMSIAARERWARQKGC